MPGGIAALTPWRDGEAFGLMSSFYEKFYCDSNPRIMLIGINPGRLGGGLTGIPFTDPVRLEDECGIANTLPKKPELSSTFFYEVVKAMGGPKIFYSRFFVSSVVPFGFTIGGKNLNYYDDPKLLETLQPLIPKWLEKQMDMGISRSVFFSIGEGENAKFLFKLNQKMDWFDDMKALPHPRFIMQYKKKYLKDFINRYVEVLSQTNSIHPGRLYR